MCLVVEMDGLEIVKSLVGTNPSEVTLEATPGVIAPERRREADGSNSSLFPDFHPFS